MKKMIGVVSIILAAFLVSNAYAQFGKSIGPRFYSDFKPVVGGWSEYQVTPKGEPPSKMKIAIVGKEGEGYWYETVIEGKQEGRVISKMLVAGNPGDQKNVRRMIFKTGNDPAMEMPVKMMQQGSQSQEPKGKMIDKGEETIKVPAGTFKTQHYQYQDEGVRSEAWVHKDVSPYGVVKSQSKDFEMVLTGYGTGARTLITETPQKFEMPKLPRGMPKGSKPGKSEEDDD
ncbi:MAG: hypothetical protein A2156_16105 [Deltaproteobacteria bacterium RBG_16_48_10]|nr:MAG: hypothetical protein A2156_16105 [Deltaproteobacteria bacterium RBG_16_48_10]